MNILVTGGTGHLGRDFVRAALAAGHRVRIASRRPRPQDGMTGIFGVDPWDRVVRLSRSREGWQTHRIAKALETGGK